MTALVVGVTVAEVVEVVGGDMEEMRVALRPGVTCGLV